MEGNGDMKAQMTWMPSNMVDKSDVKKKWPGPVTFDEERHHVRLSLTIPQLKKKRLFSKHHSDVDVVCKFTQQSVIAEVTVDISQDGKSSTIVYTYHKNLPEDIDPDESSKQIKDGYLVLKMRKMVPTSWAQHFQYFIERPEDVPL